MPKIEQTNRDREDIDNYDFEEASYTLLPRGPFADKWKHHDRGDAALGEVREPEIFETEHHVYSTPFNYENVELRNWTEGHTDKGPEFLADRGSITIVEDKPIVEVTVVGSGCEANNYNIVEWWDEGETLRNYRGQLVKRQRVDGLQGQHPAWIQKALCKELPEFETVEEAEAFLKKIQRYAHAKTSNYTMPGSLMSGLYENTVHFRIGDTSREELTAHKVVIRGGGLDYEDPMEGEFEDGPRNRYPADYVFRLIDVTVRK
ncbi:MAG: hypothetical protein KGZ25_11270 [Planctomycetes bacterium]|nr:hypothetical protein [Planctomycetota bacterium]